MSDQTHHPSMVHASLSANVSDLIIIMKKQTAVLPVIAVIPELRFHIQTRPRRLRSKLSRMLSLVSSTQRIRIEGTAYRNNHRSSHAGLQLCEDPCHVPA